MTYQSPVSNLSVFEQSDKEDADEELSDSKGTPKGRKKIRKIIDDVNLRAETQEALREEEERCKRLADREQQMEDRRDVLHTQQVKLTIKLLFVVHQWVFTVVLLIRCYFPVDKCACYMFWGFVRGEANK